jgi:hypothetical protein
MVFPWPALMAAAPEPAKLGTMKSPVLWTTLALVVALLLGALVIAVAERWRKTTREGRSDAGDQLAHFRRLYERGELSREEFERIRAKLGTRLRKELDMPAPAAAPPAAPAVPAVPPPNGESTTPPPAPPA